MRHCRPTARPFWHILSVLWFVLFAGGGLLCALFPQPAGAQLAAPLDLTGVDGVRSDAWDISDTGFVAGSWSAGGDGSAARWEVAGGVVTRTVIVPSGLGLYVNNAGDVAGVYGDVFKHTGFLYSNGVRHDIEPFPGHSHVQVTGMNASGQVIGYSQGANSTRGFLYSGGVTT
jgi:probable HAF family extracellular repeat protein